MKDGSYINKVSSYDGYGRYTVEVSSFEGDKRFDIVDDYLDRQDYAIVKQDGTIYSHCQEAVDFVSRVLGLASDFVVGKMNCVEDFIKAAQPDECYELVMDGAFGGIVDLVEL